MTKKSSSKHHKKISNNINLVLSKKEFNQIYKFIDTIKAHINDVCIVNGKFRTRSNDLKCIFETEFPFLKTANFIIGNINYNAKKLSGLNKKIDINISIDDKHVAFSDQTLKINLDNVNPKYCDNKFIPDKEMNDKYLSNIDSNRPYIRETIRKTELSRIIKVTRRFNTMTIAFKHEKNNLDKGYLFICEKNSSGNKIKNICEYSLKLKKKFLIPMKKDHYFNASYTPFVLNKSDLELNFYHHKTENIIFLIYHIVISGLQVNIYGHAKYIKD
jgi:hypothetical protein